MDRSLRDIWGRQAVPGKYAGHQGLVYDPRPSSICELLVGTERWSDRVLLVQGDRRLTHGGFRDAVAPAAELLAAQGVGRGSSVMLLAYNSPEFVLALWACWWLGAVPVFGNRWWSSAELQHGLVTTRPVLVITDVPDWSDAAASLPITALRSAYAATSRLAPYSPIDEDEPALVLFTSGSSGAPKAAVLSQRSVVANQHNLLHRSKRLPQDLSDDGPQSVSLLCTPLFHIGGVSNILVAQITGSRLVLNAGKFDAAQVLQLIEAERVQSWGGVPTMAVRLLEHPDFPTRDLSSLRSFPLGGAPVTDKLLRLLVEKLPQLGKRGLANTWGMTETGGFCTVAGNADLEQRPGTVGLPYAVAELRIDAPDDEGVGEVLLRSPTVMLGYLGLDDDDTVDAEGWLHTGDLGHLDDDGYLYLDGRSKDIVIRGGENIACGHVEQALLCHPDVVEAAVVGLPHEDLGEELAAIVRCREGVDEDQLRIFLKGQLAYFEVPSRWWLTSEPLPTLAGEKIDKKALRATFPELELT